MLAVFHAIPIAAKSDYCTCIECCSVFFTSLLPPRCPQRLAAGEWFTARVSACGVFAALQGRAPAQQKTELRSLYTQLCRDETPMVRRAAAQKLGDFATNTEADVVGRELMPLFTELTNDGKTVGRLLTLPTAEFSTAKLLVLPTFGVGRSCLLQLAPVHIA